MTPLELFASHAPPMPDWFEVPIPMPPKPPQTLPMALENLARDYSDSFEGETELVRHLASLEDSSLFGDLKALPVVETASLIVCRSAELHEWAKARVAAEDNRVRARLYLWPWHWARMMVKIGQQPWPVPHTFWKEADHG